MNKSPFNRNILYILTILEAIEKIFIYSKEYSDAEVFFNANDQKEFNATLNLLIAIGEEVKKIEDDLKSKHEINWFAIAALRNELSHNYRGVDPDIIWDIISNHLQPLKKICTSIIKGMKIESNLLKDFISTPHYKHLGYLVK